MNKFALLAAGVALSQAGCFAGYAYPTLDHVPGVRVDAPPDEVLAVRVDHRIVLGTRGYSPSTGTECRFRPLAGGWSAGRCRTRGCSRRSTTAWGSPRPGRR